MIYEKLADYHYCPDFNEIVEMLSVSSSEELGMIRKAAEATLLHFRGPSVYFRGLIEFSNVCMCNCYYCGIQRDNRTVKRYELTKEQIVESAVWCAEQGYGSIVLQSGERSDNGFVTFVEDIVGTIKEKSRRENLPDGLGITLSCGEQSKETYKRWFDAGAHRYLLRIETTSPDIFSKIHPAQQTLEARKQALYTLKEVGYVLGTGIMIGLPGQSLNDLASDILFFKDIDADMIGMGPYIVHNNTSMAYLNDTIARRHDEIFVLSLKMIAVSRLVLKNVNIAASTALQAMEEDGREQGLTYGANVIMPQVTPVEVRKNYLLYEGKPCLDENAEQCRTCLSLRVGSVGRVIAYNSWGDRELNRV
jgi:biotin synthase